MSLATPDQTQEATSPFEPVTPEILRFPWYANPWTGDDPTTRDDLPALAMGIAAEVQVLVQTTYPATTRLYVELLLPGNAETDTAERSARADQWTLVQEHLAQRQWWTSTTSPIPTAQFMRSRDHSL